MRKTTNVFEINGYYFDALETICRQTKMKIFNASVKTLINACNALKVNKIIESGKPHTVAQKNAKNVPSGRIARF